MPSKSRRYTARLSFHLQRCQSAFKFDPLSASNFDPFQRRDLTVALVSSELAGIAGLLKRQLSLPVSTMLR